MNRRLFLLGSCAGLVLSGPAFAQTVVDQIVSTLQRGGYDNIEVRRTMLGRTRITGAREDRMREIVINPRTGEILRDIIIGQDGRTLSAAVLDDDDKRDDDDKDDDDDDNDDDDDDDGDDGDDDDGDDGDDDDGGDSGGGDDDDE
jgi:hypothetical protein